MSPELVYAVCTWNRAGRLPRLLRAMRAQSCPIPFEVLVVDNNSTDETRAVVERIAAEQGGAPVRYVLEPEQGIVPARNRAIGEALSAGAEYLVFIDDDELPEPGLLEAAHDALAREGAACVGGRVKVDLPSGAPKWLDRELRGFLAEVDYGDTPRWISNRSMPLWTANIGYATSLFREDEDLRFDARYSRRGDEVGGGEDAVMFWTLLERGARIRYRPDMVVRHEVDPARLRRRYFLRLHHAAGYRHGRYRLEPRGRRVLGVPPFLLRQAAAFALRACGRALAGRPALRVAMNAAYALGMARGAHAAWRAARGAAAGAPVRGREGEA